MSVEVSPPAFQLPIRARWRDFDALKHINSAVYVTFLEEGRDAYLETRLGLPTGEHYVLAAMSLEYARPLSLPERNATIEITPLSAGRSSIRFDERIVDDQGRALLTSETVIVLWDSTATPPSSRPITDAERSALFPQGETMSGEHDLDVMSAPNSA